MCGKPPYCRPSAKEYRLCEVVRHNGSTNGIEQTNGSGTEIAVPMEEDDDEVLNEEEIVEDDDDDWESVESGEEFEEPVDEARTTTSLISEFFRGHYKDR